VVVQQPQVGRAAQLVHAALHAGGGEAKYMKMSFSAPKALGQTCCAACLMTNADCTPWYPGSYRTSIVPSAVKYLEQVPTFVPFTSVGSTCN
jgi:hypothetical protein